MNLSGACHNGHGGIPKLASGTLKLGVVFGN